MSNRRTPPFECRPKLIALFLILSLVLTSVSNSIAAPIRIPSSLVPDPTPDALRIRLSVGEFDPLVTSEPAGLPDFLRVLAYPGDGSGYYLVQFRGPVTTSDVDALRAAGAQVFDYIPDFTFIVKMDSIIRAAVEEMGQVRWVGLYQPAYRLATALSVYAFDNTPVSDFSLLDDGRQAVDPRTLWSDDPIEIVITIFPGEDLSPIRMQIETLGGVILDQSQTNWKSKLLVSISPSLLTDLTAFPGVRWIEKAPEWKLANSEAADIMGVREVWDTHGLYGAGQTIAVCDTGLDQGSTSSASLHNDFENGSGTSRVLVIHDVAGDGAPSDVNSGHGTHVAGSVLGNGDLSGATPSTHTYPDTAYAGMAPEAGLVFQASEDNGSGALLFPLDLNSLFAQAASSGADLHTNSWGSSVAGMYTSNSEEVDEYVWDHKNFTILFAAGNEGLDSDADGVIDRYSVDSPSTAKNCITVGATENNRPSGSVPTPGYDIPWGTGSWAVEFPVDPINSDHVSDDPNGMAAFSSRGPTLDGRYKPDIVTPGTNIASTRSSQISGSGWGPIDSNYMFMGGTSMATPLVAGVATLVRQYYNDIENITPSAALIKATLANGATNIAPGQYGTGLTQEIPYNRPTNVAGWGRVNLENSIFPTSPRNMLYEDETTGLGTGQSDVFNYTVSSSAEPLHVTLAWSDYPGSPTAAGGLVNDLDITITGPGGTYYPNNASQRGDSQHLTYDDGEASGLYYWNAGVRNAVRFTPISYPAALQTALFAVGSYSETYPKTFNWYVYNGNATSGPGSILASGSTTIRRPGWHPVDLSGEGVTITSGDFFLAIELPDSDLAWLYDASSPVDGRSWDYSGGSWTNWTDNDYMFNAIVTTPGDSTNQDRVNNLVGIDIDSPPTGNYVITVSGYNVPQGPQPYALVASGAVARSGVAGKTWNGSVSDDWHTADNWTPTGVPASGDDVLIPNVTNDPVISTGDAAVNSLIINSGAVLDLTERTLTVEGTLTNNGTLKQTQDVTQGSRTEFLRINNLVGNQTKYYGVDITPQDNADFSSHEALQPVELTLDSLPARSVTPHSAAISAPDAPVSLVVDDGVHESASGVNNQTEGTGKQFIWLNRFTPEAAAYPFTLDAIWVMFDSFGGGANIAVGDAIDLVIYEDSDGDPTNGATLLATIPVTVQAVDGTVWSVYSLSSPVLLEGPGDVIIAAINRYVVSGEPPMCYPATVDTTAGQDRSWIGWWWSDPPSPAVLPPDLHFELLTGTSAGNWLIRGYGSTVTANTPPTISDLPDQLLLVNDVANNAIDLWAYASDNESPDDALTFTIDNTPDPSAGVGIDSNRYIDIFPDTDWIGQTDVVVRVEDPEGLFDTDSFQVTVSSTLNTTPTISGLPDQWLMVNDVANNVIDLWTYASDNESPDDALTFTIDNTPDPSAGVGIDSNRYIDIFPDTDWTGQTDVVVRVEDPEGLFDTDSFHVTISSTLNTTPTISALPNITVPVNSTSVLPWMDLWDYADDAEDSDDQLAFTIANTPDPNAGVSIDSDRYILVLPATNWVGVTDVEIQVQDTGGLTDTDIFQVTITGTVNTSPTISGLPDQTLPVDGIANNAIDLWAYASDNESPDDALTFTIDNTPEPGAGVRIDSNRYIDIFPDTGWEGQTDVIVRVEDPEGLFDTDSFHVTIGSGVSATSVTVAVSGHQFCANRTTGVERCFDIDPATPISATVRFYFSEAERNGQSLDDLLVFHYDGDWTEEPGPYIRGGAGDAQYVEAQNVDDFSPFALDSGLPPQPDHYSIYLPLVLKRWPPIPGTPVLNSISNADGDGNYAVTWSTADLAETYTLEESSDAAFSSPTTRYTGSGTSWSASDKSAGTYYYRVRASRLWNGQTLYSAWSNVRSVVVQPPVGPPAGFWEGQDVEFYVTPDKAYVDDFAIYISVTGCGSYKIQRPSPVSLNNNQFSFSGSFYASGTLHSDTTASGNAGLDNYYIYGCGDVTGSFSWTANWVNSSQPSLVLTEVEELEKTNSVANSAFVARRR